MWGIVDVGGGRRVHRRGRGMLFEIAYVDVAARADVGQMTLGAVDVRLCGFTYWAIFSRFPVKSGTGARDGEPATNDRRWLVLRFNRHASVPDGRAALIIVVMVFFPVRCLWSSLALLSFALFSSLFHRQTCRRTCRRHR